jgi:putative MATE family efflux protein
LNKRLHSISNFFRDPDYYRQLTRLVVPMALQNFVTASLNMVALIFIGQLGGDSVAAVGLANQVWFLLNLFIFGIVSGASIFVAQLWGKQDIPNIRKVIGLTIKLGLITVFVFWVIAVFFPSFALHIYTNDPKVIEIGSRYLSIYGWSYIFYAISTIYSAALRSTGNVQLPMAVSTGALGLNVLIAYPFIFGLKLIGLPALGVEGAAIAGLISRILECLVILIMVYRDPKNPVAATIKDLIHFEVRFLIAVMKPVLPVIINEILWSLGVTVYNVIYGHIGTNAVAAINIMATIEQLAFAIFWSIGTATSILVGHQIGNGNPEKAYIIAGRSIVIQVSSGMVMGLVLFLLAGNIVNLYHVDAQVIDYSRKILTILAIGFWMKAGNHVIIIGMLRAGGDTRFSLVLDGFVIWLVGVPVLAAGAFLLHLPIYWVYALTYCEEVVKFFVGLNRYLSKKWINDLTQKVEAVSLL